MCACVCVWYGVGVVGTGGVVGESELSADLNANGTSKHTRIVIRQYQTVSSCETPYSFKLPLPPCQENVARCGCILMMMAKRTPPKQRVKYVDRLSSIVGTQVICSNT